MKVLIEAQRVATKMGLPRPGYQGAADSAVRNDPGFPCAFFAGASRMWAKQCHEPSPKAPSIGFFQTIPKCCSHRLSPASALLEAFFDGLYRAEAGGESWIELGELGKVVCTQHSDTDSDALIIVMALCFHLLAPPTSKAVVFYLPTLAEVSRSKSNRCHLFFF